MTPSTMSFESRSVGDELMSTDAARRGIASVRLPRRRRGNRPDGAGDRSGTRVDRVECAYRCLLGPQRRRGRDRDRRLRSHRGARLPRRGGAIQIGSFIGISGRVSIYSSTDAYSGEGIVGPTIPPDFREVTDAPVTVRTSAPSAREASFTGRDACGRSGGGGYEPCQG